MLIPTRHRRQSKHLIDVLTEIRNEILQQGWDDYCALKHGCIDDVLAIIDRHIEAESEG